MTGSVRKRLGEETADNENFIPKIIPPSFGKFFNCKARFDMHYRNGREAKNGDKIVKLEGGNVVAFGVLHSATPGNDFCNGKIAVIQPANDYACMCDCLHIDDVAAILGETGLDKRPAGM